MIVKEIKTFTKKTFFSIFLFFVCVLFTIATFCASVFVNGADFLILLSLFGLLLIRFMWWQKDDSIVISSDGIAYDVHDGFFFNKPLKGMYKWDDGECNYKFETLIIDYSDSRKVKFSLKLFSSQLSVELYSALFLRFDSERLLNTVDVSVKGNVESRTSYHVTVEGEKLKKEGKETFCVFNEDKNITSWKSFYTTGEIRKQCSYTYEGGKIVKSNENGDEGKYLYGANGLLEHVEFSNHDDLSFDKHYTYDSNGVLSEEVWAYKSNTESRFYYSTDNEGYYIDKNDNLVNGKVVTSILTKTDNDQKLLEGVTTENGQVVDKTVYTYNSSGVLEKTVSYDGDDSLLGETIYSYDNDGNLVKEEIFDDDHNLLKKILYKNDEYGNVIEERVYEEGKLSDGVIYTYEYRLGDPIA